MPNITTFTCYTEQVTEGIVNAKTRIFVASVVGLTLVSVAYSLSQKSAENKVSATSIVESQAPARSFIPITDSNEDSIPDWQEGFVFGEVNLDGISPDSPYKPDTMSGKVIVELAQKVMDAKVNKDPNFSSAELLSETNKRLSIEALDEQYEQSDIIITSDNSQATLRAYGNRVASISIDRSPKVPVQNELVILNNALKKNDPNLLSDLEITKKSYDNMIADMLATPVPSSLVREHLSLINVYQALSSDIGAFQNVFVDALPSMLRFRRYSFDAQALYTAISNLYLKLNKAGIQWNESDAASQLIKIDA